MNQPLSTTVYDSASKRSPAIDELLELWRYRDLLRLLVVNSIKTRYKRSALGVIWTLLNPLFNTLVLTIALSQLMRFELQNYPVYLLVGFIFWTFFAQTTQESMHRLIWGSSLIKRIYVPRTIFSISVLGNGLVNFTLALIPLFVIMLFMGHPIRSTFLLLPFAILIFAMFTVGVALFISTLAVFFVDFVEIYSVGLSALFYLTPIIYPLSVVPEQYRQFIAINPISIMLELFRSLIYWGELPATNTVLAATALAVFAISIGWWAFTQKVDEFAYRI